MEQLGPLFVHPKDPSFFWILVVVVALPVLLVALVVLVRGRLPAALSAMAFLLLPPFGYILGDINLLEQSKKVTFCVSCHETMSPLLVGLREDEETLAAHHFQVGAVSHVDACYKCHSGYGIWGGVGAKTAGVQHMLHTVTGGFDYPLKPSKDFDIHSCLSCHAEALPFRAVDVHRDPDMQQALLAGEMTCTGMCHPAAHPDWALHGVHAMAEARKE